MRPNVSVIIPTLDRAHLLRTALRSCVEQTDAQIEIVVSNNRSSDDTTNVIASFTDPRIRHLTPSRRLTMVENFEFALENASGEYVTFLTDDSYLSPVCIDVALAALREHDLQLVAWNNARYFHPNWLESGRRNTLYLPRMSGRIERRDSRSSLEHWFKHTGGPTIPMPRSINSLCHRSVVESVLASQGAFFLPPAPDHTSGAAMLLHTDEYLFIDRPLVVDGVTLESTGASQSFSMGKSARDFYDSFGKDLKGITFLGIPTTATIVAQSFENVRRYYPDCPALDVRDVVTETIDNLAKLQVYGTDVSRWREVLDAFVRGSVPELGAYAKRRWYGSLLKWRAVRLTRSSRMFDRLEMLRGLEIHKGSRYGFSDIVGCTKYLVDTNRFAAA